MPKIPKVILLLATERAHARGLFYGIVKYSRLHGPWMFYQDAPFYREPGSLTRLMNWDADGVIAPDAEENKEIIAMGLPTIVYRMKRRRIPNLPVITADNDTVGKMAAEHLLDRGFRHFAYCGIEGRPWSQERSQSFCTRIEQAGFQIHSFYNLPPSPARRLSDAEQNHLADWLRSLPKPVGMLVGNDDCGRHVMETCKNADLKVPDEAAILGVDNDELICDLTDPPLSSIVLNTQRAGFEAAELLDRLMAGEKMAGQSVIVHPTHIVTRQSSDILAIEDWEVAEAVRFIRQHSKKSVQVRDVVDAVAMSRRNLELRFRKILGRSVYSEIKRVRTQQIIRLLEETDLSIAQIALKLGHPSDKHIARFFRQQTGINLTDYRRRYGRGD